MASSTTIGCIRRPPCYDFEGRPGVPVTTNYLSSLSNQEQNIVCCTPSGIPVLTEGDSTSFLDGAAGSGDQPIIGTGQPGNVIRIRTDNATCGDIIQYRPTIPSGAHGWYIVQSGGQVNVAAGVGGLFPDVTSAFNVGCIHVRVISNITEAAIAVPNGAVVYIDPGVTWTTGQLTLSGSFTLLGNADLSSSTWQTSLVAPSKAVVGTGMYFYMRGVKWDGSTGGGGLVPGDVFFRIDQCRLIMPTGAVLGLICLGTSVLLPIIDGQISQTIIEKLGVAASLITVCTGDTTSKLVITDCTLVGLVSWQLFVRSTQLTINGIRSYAGIRMEVRGNISDISAIDDVNISFIEIDNSDNANFNNLNANIIKVGGAMLVAFCTFDNLVCRLAPVPIGPLLPPGSVLGLGILLQNCTFNNVIIEMCPTIPGALAATFLSGNNCHYNNFQFICQDPVNPSNQFIAVFGDDNVYNNFLLHNTFTPGVNNSFIQNGDDCVLSNWLMDATGLQISGNLVTVTNLRIKRTTTNLIVVGENCNVNGGIIGLVSAAGGTITATVPVQKPTISNVLVETAPVAPGDVRSAILDVNYSLI